MNTPESKSRPNDELDLTQFFQWTGRGLKRMGAGIIYGIAALRNMFFENLKFFAIVIVTGLIFGFVYSKLLKLEYYKSSMILSCSYLSTQALDNTIQNLNLLCEDKEKTGLKTELGISDSVARSIIFFEYKTFVSEDDIVEMEVLKEQLTSLAENKQEIVDKVINRLTIENKDAYKITVSINDLKSIKPLEGALVDYFKKNNYIKKRIEATHKSRTVRREKLITESKKLDSLKRLIFGNLVNQSKTERGSNNVILDREATGNPLDVFKEDLRINNEILNIDYDIYIQPDFELMEGFTAINRPAGPSLFRILAIAFVISWISGYVILFASKFDRMLATYANKP